MTPEVAQWFATWWPIWSPIVVLILGGASTGIWVMVNRRDGDKTARKNPLPPTWPEMWARIDIQDGRIDALERELRAAGAENDRKDDQIDDLITHILKLELLVPSPPGPPPRPAWVTR